ncbi:MAG: hypothetical protein JWQ65_2429 [Devosia sp.]|nr:hypothetical protein [Devosia sp.]
MKGIKVYPGEDFGPLFLANFVYSVAFMIGGIFFIKGQPILALLTVLVAIFMPYRLIVRRVFLRRK